MMTYQRKLEWGWALVEVVSMLLVCYGFAYSRNSATLDAFNLDLHTNLTFAHYAAMSAIGAAAAPLMMLPFLQRLEALWRRYIFLIPMLPLLFYCLPFGWVFLRGSGGNPVGGAVYLIVFLIFVGAAFTLHRPTTKATRNASHNAGANRHITRASDY